MPSLTLRLDSDGQTGLCCFPAGVTNLMASDAGVALMSDRQCLRILIAENTSLCNKQRIPTQAATS
jgi:hypothetical protein